MEPNDMLYAHITKTYGSIVGFAEESGVSLVDLHALLLKDSVAKDIRAGFDLCRILQIDAGELALSGQIKRTGKILSEAGSGYGNEIHAKCVKLSEREKQKVLDYIDAALKMQK